MVSRFLVSTNVARLNWQLLPLPPSLTTASLVAVQSGHVIEVFVSKQAGDGNSKPWVILLNPPLGDYVMWDPWLAHLTKTCNVLGLNLPGQGKVSKPVWHLIVLGVFC